MPLVLIFSTLCKPRLPSVNHCKRFHLSEVCRKNLKKTVFLETTKTEKFNGFFNIIDHFKAGKPKLQPMTNFSGARKIPKKIKKIKVS